MRTWVSLLVCSFNLVAFGLMIATTQPLIPYDAQSFIGSEVVASEELQPYVDSLIVIIANTIARIYASAPVQSFDIAAVYTPLTFGFKIYISPSYPDASYAMSAALSGIGMLHIISRNFSPFEPTMLVYLYDLDSQLSLAVAYFQEQHLIILSTSE